MADIHLPSEQHLRDQDDRGEQGHDLDVTDRLRNLCGVALESTDWRLGLAWVLHQGGPQHLVRLIRRWADQPFFYRDLVELSEVARPPSRTTFSGNSDCPACAS